MKTWPVCALLLLVSCSTLPPAEENVEVNSGEQALELLTEGNARFAAGRPLHTHESQARRMKLEGGQNPFAIVLGCADSRVPPELIFDRGLGDLFVIRVAGNVVGVDESGSIEYAIEHLGTPLVLVMGHEGCGAVTAALDENGKEIRELMSLIATIAEGLTGIDPDLPASERVHLGVEANVRRSVQQLETIQAREQVQGQRALIVGAVYELETGRVRLLE